MAKGLELESSQKLTCLVLAGDYQLRLQLGLLARTPVCFLSLWPGLLHSPVPGFQEQASEGKPTRSYTAVYCGATHGISTAFSSLEVSHRGPPVFRGGRNVQEFVGMCKPPYSGSDWGLTCRF